MPLERHFPVLQPTAAELNSILQEVAPILHRRAVAKGIVRPEDICRISALNAFDLGQKVGTFEHTFTAAHTYEKYVDAYTLGDMCIAIVGIASDDADPGLYGVRFSVGVPLRPITEQKFQAMLMQKEPKIIFKRERVVYYDKGDRVTIELIGRRTGAESFILLGLKAEKG